MWSPSVREIEVVAVPGEDAIVELDVALNEAEATGFHPILMGDAADYEVMLERMEQGEEAEQILRKAVEVSVPDWFDSQPGSERVNGKSAGHVTPTESRLVTHLDPTTRLPKPTVLVGVFKVPAPWHTFAHLSWGDWNSCPSPAVHCAVHRYWMERYGAKVISITSQAVQCQLTMPPTDREAALQLAHEQSRYCRSLVHGPSLVNLAERLVNAKYWYFRWE